MTVLEKHKKAGVHYALDNGGVELPVIDITHPAFAVELGDAELATLIEGFVADARKREKLPAFLQRALLAVVLRGSTLAKGLRGASTSFLGGMPTYLMKLGPDNLGRAYTVAVDRKIAASLPALSMRLRLQDMARLLADGLAPILARRPGRPLHLFNIAGGPSSDSLNALLLLRRQAPGALVGRPIVIHVLDLDGDGPAFGARALLALQAEGAPLHGLGIGFERIEYRWAETEGLKRALEAAQLADAVVAASSEGGLFEYGSDEEIVANLEALRRGTPDDVVVVGSVTRAEGPIVYLKQTSPIPTRPRPRAAFEALAARGGFHITQGIERPFSNDLRLVKA